MTSLPAFLDQAKDIPRKHKKKKYTISESNMSSSMYLMSDFALPMWQRLQIEALEGMKTIKGVAKDIATKKVYNDPKTKKMWQEDLGRGFAEARNRVKQSLRKANDKNIMSELEKNKALDLQVDRMRQAAKKSYKEKGIPDLSRASADGLLNIDKRYKRGAKYGN